MNSSSSKGRLSDLKVAFLFAALFALLTESDRLSLSSSRFKLIMTSATQAFSTLKVSENASLK